MYKCSECGKEDRSNPMYRFNKCPVHEIEKEFGMPKVYNTVFLKTYGNVPENRLKEMEKRVILPDNHPESGSYYVGTKENGKIKDKVPNIKK